MTSPSINRRRSTLNLLSRSFRCFLIAAGAGAGVLLTMSAPAQGTDETSAIRTPVAPASPRINGPRVYGARPGRPFFYHLPVTGERPMMITAAGLPEGLTLDLESGNITGSVTKEGDYSVTFTAKNAKGTNTAPLHIVIGPTICLTPPMGWNSWNYFQGNIDEAKIKGAADSMVATGLIDHGWTYINMDDRWEGQRDAEGNIQSSAKIPDMKELADYIHGKGLKVGLYSSPGARTCAGAVASYQHEDQDAATYAAWDMDYLKYDWCSYESVANTYREDQYSKMLTPDKAVELKSLSMEKDTLRVLRHDWNAAPVEQTDEVRAIEAKYATANKQQLSEQIKEIDEHLNQLHKEVYLADPAKFNAINLDADKAPYIKMRASLDNVNRDIVFSFCQYGMGNVWEWGAQTGGNLWRTTGDISANWKSVEDHGFKQNGLEKWAGPGHWNDPDMLEVGNGDLTPDENYTHMTMWCMLSAPLLIGCNMPAMSPLIVSMFSNDEVLAVNQDALGKQGWRATQNGQQEVWMKPLADGSTAVAFFNRADAPADVSVKWSDLKLIGTQAVRDLWRQKDAGTQADGYSVNVAAHGAELFKVSKE
jgi:alpha-galactosidase